MSKVTLVIKREYLQRVRTRGFIFSTLGTPLLIAAVTLVPLLLAHFGSSTRRVTVVDQSGRPGLYESIKRRVEDPEIGAVFILTHVVVPPGQDLSALKQECDLQSEKQVGLAYIVLPSTILDGTPPEYYARNTTDLYLSRVGRAISTSITEQRFVRDGIATEKTSEYLNPVVMKTIRIGGTGEAEQGLRYVVVAYIMLFAIYLTILIYGVSVMRGVIEEKQTRIVEILLSSIKPFELMMGKLIGIGLVGLTQYAVWISSTLLITTLGAAAGGTGDTLVHLPLSLFVYFVIYFVLGYFLFATLYAIIGATVSGDQDTHGVQTPVMVVLMIPMMVITFIALAPNSPTSVILSMIPTNAPTLMILRLAITNPPAWQIALSMILMLATIFVALWAAAKIYRVGVLMYGKRPGLRELSRWLRYA